MDKIEIGAVAKPQGIKGELKIKLFADDFKSVSEITCVWIKDVRYGVQSFKAISGDEAIIKLAEVEDRNAAELLRRESLFAKREEIILPKGRFFIADVIGCKLFLSSGKEIGEISEIINGNVDYYYVDSQEGKAIFPLIKELSAVFDIENRRVTVDAKKFTEVVIYEN